MKTQKIPKGFKTFESKGNGWLNSWYELDGKRLEEGMKLEILWKNGTRSVAEIGITKREIHDTDMGMRMMGVAEFPYVQIKYRGVCTEVYIEYLHAKMVKTLVKL